MTLKQTTQDNIEDAQKRMDSLPYRSKEWWKQRRRRLENHLMGVALNKPDNINKTRERIKETYFHSESFMTIPPANKNK